MLFRGAGAIHPPKMFKRFLGVVGLIGAVSGPSLGMAIELSGPFLEPTDRCLVEDVPIKATRHGIDGWFRGYGRVPDYDTARAKLAERDQKQTRVSELVVDEKLLDSALKDALKSAIPQIDLKSKYYDLRCGKPELKLSLDQKIRVRLACATQFKAPFNTQCEPTKDENCTGIEIELQPVLRQVDENTIHLAARWELIDLKVTLPELTGWFDERSQVFIQDVENARERIVKELQSGKDFDEVLKKVVELLRGRAQGIHEAIAHLERQRVQLQKDLAKFPEITRDIDEFAKAMKQMLPANVTAQPGFESWIRELKPHLKEIRGLAIQVETQLKKADSLVKDLYRQIESLESDAEAQILGLAKGVENVSQAIEVVENTTADLKMMLEQMPQIAILVDRGVGDMWLDLVGNLKKQLQAQMPAEIDLVSIGPYSVDQLLPIGVSAKTRYQFELPRIEKSLDNDGLVFVVPMRASRLEIEAGGNSANSGGGRHSDVPAGHAELRLDERMVKDFVADLWRKYVEEMVVTQVKGTIEDSGIDWVVRKVDVKIRDPYEGIRFSKTMDGGGIQLEMSTHVEVSTLPLGSFLMKRVRVEGPVSVKTALAIQEGQLIMTKPEVAMKLRMSCVWWVHSSICDGLRRNVYRTQDRLLRELTAKLEDMVLLKKVAFATAIPGTGRLAKGVVEKLDYVEPSCPATATEKMTMYSGWLRAKVGVLW